MIPHEHITAYARAARESSRALATLSAGSKDTYLRALADALHNRRGEVLDANAQDVERARADGLDRAKLRRLELTDTSIDQMCAGVRQIASLPDPVAPDARTTREYDVPTGLHVRKVRCPLGVVCMIYEARPAVTIDAFALCFKSGNACVLKGGKEARLANTLLAQIARSILAEHGLPEASITSISGISRDQTRHLLSLDSLIDLVIPRGNTSLIRFVAEHSSIPTIQHDHGVNHIYVDKAADPSGGYAEAVEICVTAKTSAPATCNAVECVLVHKDSAAGFLPAFIDRCGEEGVLVRADGPAMGYFDSSAAHVEQASADDFGREYLDLTLAVKVVGTIDEAIGHIQRFGSNHTEAILTRDNDAAERFVNEVQASCVLVNASTRFNDGFQLGLGAEIGISTSKIHAYGPMGLEELTTQRFIVTGTGQTR